jgi:hypothetical protein
MFLRGALPLSWLWLLGVVLCVYMDVIPAEALATLQHGHPLLWSLLALAIVTPIIGLPANADELKAGSTVAVITLGLVSLLGLVVGGVLT